VAMDAPEKVTPRGSLDLPVTVSSLASGEAAFVTVAAVDEGILQLTHFTSPDPAAYFFGQRRLAADIRDDYGSLLDGRLKAAQIRSGGDSMGAGLPVVPVHSVALFEGPVALDRSGKATIHLDVPDFEGELRLMVVASSRSGVGSASKPLTVRDPVV